MPAPSPEVQNALRSFGLPGDISEHFISRRVLPGGFSFGNADPTYNGGIELGDNAPVDNILDAEAWRSPAALARFFNNEPPPVDNPSVIGVFWGWEVMVDIISEQAIAGGTLAFYESIKQIMDWQRLVHVYDDELTDVYPVRDALTYGGHASIVDNDAGATDARLVLHDRGPGRFNLGQILIVDFEQDQLFTNYENPMDLDTAINPEAVFTFYGLMFRSSLWPAPRIRRAQQSNPEVFYDTFKKLATFLRSPAMPQ